MRTSIDIPERLLHEAKELAHKRHTTLREVVLEGLRTVLDHTKSRPKSFRLKDLSYGNGGLVEGLLATDWDEMRKRAYEGRGG